jgi:hypothetical protein
VTQLNIAEAAKISGRNRTTIIRAMKTGRLSFTRNGAGERRIDTAELERVFPATVVRTAQSDTVHLSELLEAERSKTVGLERTIDDLRQRLDASEGERRQVQARLDALLPTPTPKLRGWRFWRR